MKWPTLITRILTVAAILIIPVGVRADLVGTGSGGSIPDQFLGDFSSVITFDVDEEITDVTVKLNRLNHTWAGDLIIWLKGPDGSTVDLVNRLGYPDETWGRGDNYDGDYAFNDAFVDDLWATTGDPVTPGEYFPTKELGVPDSLLGAFLGDSSLGDWTLYISDEEVTEEGSIGSWTLELKTIPEPSTWVLFAVGSLVLVVVQRRQRRKPQ